MPKKSYGTQVKKRVRRLLEALLCFVDGEFLDGSFDIKHNNWFAEDSKNPKLIIQTNLVTLELLTAKDKYPGKLTKPQIREALKLLDRDSDDSLLKILEDNRATKRGSGKWHFTLKLWSKDKEENLKRFDEVWENNRPSKSKTLEANYQQDKGRYTEAEPLYEKALSLGPELPRPSASQPLQLEIPSGTMNVESSFYVERRADKVALHTIVQSGVTIVIKGPRQVGKTSLLNRIIEAAIDASKAVLFLDFQLLGKADLNSDEIFFRRFCSWVSEDLELEDRVDEYWQTNISHIQRCTRYMSRYILKELGSPLVLVMDEVDKVFDKPFRSDFFGMLRNWHSRRAMSYIWNNLDLVLVASTEVYQLIDDLIQSPFNVGQVIELEDFTSEQVADLNRRHGSPLNPSEEKQLMVLLGGHPFLVRWALYLVASGQISSSDLFAHATDEDGPFGNHLRHNLSLLHDKQELIQGLLEIITHNTCTDRLVFWRLRGAGLVRSSGKTVTTRCQLYADYFRDVLNGSSTGS